VTAAMKRSPAGLWWDERLGEPLAVLARSLDEQADLSSPGRRGARQLLIDLLLADRPPTTPTVSETRVLIVTGAPGVDLDATMRACRDRGCVELQPVTAVDDARPIGSTDTARFAASWFVSSAFEYRWHVPDFAEWMQSPPGRRRVIEVLSEWLTVAAAIDNGDTTAESPFVIAGVGFAEPLQEILATLPSARALIVGSSMPEQDHTRFREAVIAQRARTSLRHRPEVDARYVEWRLDAIKSALANAAESEPGRIRVVSSDPTTEELGFSAG